jgi:hypothetical protein
MNKRIQSYSDLVAERERLQMLLEMQKEIVSGDIAEIKEQLKPVTSFLSFSGKLITRDGSNFVLNAGANTIIDLVVKKLILSRAGWLTRRVVPFLLKNYSSHFLSENKGVLLEKLFSWIGKRNANGKEEVS